MTDIKATSSRRNMIKGGIAAAGVAYVAPAVLNTSVAGALTTTCYNIKYDGTCLNPIDASGGDSGCSLFAPTSGGTPGSAAEGNGFVEVLSGSCGNPSGVQELVLKITCPVGTTITDVTAAVKGGGNPTDGCKVVTNNYIQTNANVAIITFDNAGLGNDGSISHVSFGFCCTTSS